MEKKIFNDLEKLGYFIIPNLIDDQWIDRLGLAIDSSFEIHRKIQKENKNDIRSNGVALHVLLNDDVFVKFLQHLIDIGFVKGLSEYFFGSNCILNSFSALNNLPSSPNFSSTVHRDLRFYSQGLPVMINCLLMVDDFTNENGATRLLPYSHLKEGKPSDEYFLKKSVQATGKRGSMLIFDSNVWHSSAPNTTEHGRRGIPITISRSFLKQLLDYPRAIGYEKMGFFSQELQQFLGYHSRVPASLDEWYQPEDKRFYKKNQD